MRASVGNNSQLTEVSICVYTLVPSGCQSRNKQAARSERLLRAFPGMLMKLRQQRPRLRTRSALRDVANVFNPDGAGDGSLPRRRRLQPVFSRLRRSQGGRGRSFSAEGPTGPKARGRRCSSAPSKQKHTFAAACCDGRRPSAAPAVLVSQELIRLRRGSEDRRRLPPDVWAAAGSQTRREAEERLRFPSEAVPDLRWLVFTPPPACVSSASRPSSALRSLISAARRCPPLRR